MGFISNQATTPSLVGKSASKRIRLFMYLLLVPIVQFAESYPTIDIIATEIAGNYLFPWKDANWLTCPIIYMEVLGENIKTIK